MDEAVRRWRQKGNVYFWFEHDGGQGFGWHLAADEPGCASLNELAELALTAEFPSRFNVNPSKGRGSQPRMVSKLTISHDRDWPATHWNLHERDDRVVMELGRQRLVEFQKMLSRLADGRFNDMTFPNDIDTDVPLWI